MRTRSSYRRAVTALTGVLIVGCAVRTERDTVDADAAVEEPADSRLRELFGSDPGRNDVVGGAICQRFAEILCVGQKHCCRTQDREGLACLSAVADYCENSLSLDDSSGNPVTGFDEASASHVFAELEVRVSQCALDIGEWSFSTRGLAGAFTGTLDAGADCTPPGGLLGQMADILAALGSCKDLATTACLPGMDYNAPWTCQPRSSEGGPCYSDLNCEEGLYCDPPFDVVGTCRERKAVGEPCILFTECQSFLCRQYSCVEATIDNAYCPVNLH